MLLFHDFTIASYTSDSKLTYSMTNCSIQVRGSSSCRDPFLITWINYQYGWVITSLIKCVSIPKPKLCGRWSLEMLLHPILYWACDYLLSWNWSWSMSIKEGPVRSLMVDDIWKYRTISNIMRTKCQNLNVSRLALQLSLRNILKPCVKWRMKM